MLLQKRAQASELSAGSTYLRKKPLRVLHFKSIVIPKSTAVNSIESNTTESQSPNDPRINEKFKNYQGIWQENNENSKKILTFTCEDACERFCQDKAVVENEKNSGSTENVEFGECSKTAELEIGLFSDRESILELIEMIAKKSPEEKLQSLQNLQIKTEDAKPSKNSCFVDRSPCFKPVHDKSITFGNELEPKVTDSTASNIPVISVNSRLVKKRLKIRSKSSKFFTENSSTTTHKPKYLFPLHTPCSPQIFSSTSTKLQDSVQHPVTKFPKTLCSKLLSHKNFH